MMGAIGVIATLAYLALQIRQSGVATRTSNYWQLTSQMRDFMAQLSSDPELLAIYQRGVVSYTSLDEHERARFHMLLSGLFTTYQVMLQLREAGQLNQTMYGEMFDGIFSLLELSGVQEWWGNEGYWFADSFRAWVDAAIERMG